MRRGKRSHARRASRSKRSRGRRRSKSSARTSHPINKARPISRGGLRF